MLSVARFIYLQADFPIDLGDPGMAYTDEGWWSRNAIAWVREGNWYIDDGYNPITYLPILSVFQVLWFKLFGASLGAARAISVLCSLLVSVLVYDLARQEIRPQIAWIAPFIVLSSYPVFAYSRLAILEMPMILLILASLWLAVTPFKRQLPAANQNTLHTTSLFKIVGSGVLFAIAIFTKTTALFALPVVALLLLLRSGFTWRSVRTHLKSALLWLLIVGITVGIFHLLLQQFGDVQSQTHFSNYNVTQKVPSSPSSAWKGPFRVVERSARLFPLMFIGLLGAITLFIKEKIYYSSQLFRTVTLWSAATLSAFSLSNFAALRYFLVLIVPIALVVPLTLQYAFTEKSLTEKAFTKPAFTQQATSTGKTVLSKRNQTPLSFKNLTPPCVALLLIFTLSTGYSLARIANYLSTPHFTLVETADTIEHYIEQDNLASNVVMGHFADTVALTAQQIKAVNDKFGFRSLEYRIKTFNPAYYLSIGEIEPERQQVIESDYQIDLIKTFDLYQNRDYDKPVFLYRLTR